MTSAQSSGMATIDLDQLTSVTTLEYCGKALWEQRNGKDWREWFPWDSDHPEARAARVRAVEGASAVLQALQTFCSEDPR